MNDVEKVGVMVLFFNGAAMLLAFLEFRQWVNRLSNLSRLVSLLSAPTAGPGQQSRTQSPSSVQPLVVVLEAKGIRQWLQQQGQAQATPASKQASDGPASSGAGGLAESEASQSADVLASLRKTEQSCQSRQAPVLHSIDRAKQSCDGFAVAESPDSLRPVSLSVPLVSPDPKPEGYQAGKAVLL